MSAHVKRHRKKVMRIAALIHVLIHTILFTEVDNSDYCDRPASKNTSLTSKFDIRCEEL